MVKGEKLWTPEVLKTKLSVCLFKWIAIINVEKKMKKVAFIGGYWAPNIGNAFFNLGANYVLNQIFEPENVTMVFDQPAYITQWNTNKGNPPWAIDYWSHLNVDYVCLLGPVLTKAFLPIWKQCLDKLKERGIKYMILSAGMMKYDKNVIQEIKSYFKINPPYVMTTRDTDTYKTFKEDVSNIYDGICFAFFMPECYKPISTDLTPLMAINFDKIDEPHIYIDEPEKPADILFEFENQKISMKFGGVFSKLGLKTDRFTDAIVYAMSPLPRGKRPVKIGKYNIIRTDHRFAPMFMRKVYRYNNSFCADIPHTYANIYAEAEITLSDRVHACAVTLAYGNAAYLFAKTGRSSLLHRVGAVGIEDHPVKIDLDYLNNEKSKMIQWLKSIKY